MVRTNQNYFILESVASLAMTVSKSDEYYIHKLGSVTDFGKLKEKMRNDPLLSLRRLQFRGSIRKVGVFVQYKDKVCRL